MSLLDLNLSLVTKNLLQITSYVTCRECCKYYVNPYIALCGHSACKSCWLGLRTCSACAMPVTKCDLRLNNSLRKRTKNVMVLIEVFEKLYSIRLDSLEILDGSRIENQPNKTVKDGLTNSQNKISASFGSEKTDKDFNPNISDVKNHSSDVIVVSNPQGDYDKIEQISEIVQSLVCDTKNTRPADPTVTNNVNIPENFWNHGKYKQANSVSKTLESHDIFSENLNGTISRMTDKPPNKIKTTLNSFQRTKNDFPKINKENKNRLNVSIETGEKSQKENLTILPNQKETISDTNGCHKVFGKKDLGKNNNFCNINDVNQDTEFSNNSIHHVTLKDMGKIPEFNYSKEKVLATEYSCNPPINTKNTCENSLRRKPLEVKFFKKSILHNDTKRNLLPNNNIGTDIIRISVQIGKTLTKVFIKNQENEAPLIIHSKQTTTKNQETQTSLNNGNIFFNNENESKLQKNVLKELNFVEGSIKMIDAQFVDEIHQKYAKTISSSTTDCTETGTAQFKIIDSAKNETMQKNNSQIRNTAANLQNLPQKEISPKYIENDIDIFDSESQKTSSGQLLKSSREITSAVLVQNNIHKRKLLDKTSLNSNCKENLPFRKKRKINGKDKYEPEIEIDNIIENNHVVVSDSESNNYDLDMDKVFTDVDVDFKTTDKRFLTATNSRDCNENMVTTAYHFKSLKGHDFLTNFGSENVFSVQEVSKPQGNVESLTHCKEVELLHGGRNIDEGDMEEEILSTPINNNLDFDKSVVEETPQKKVSFQKSRQNQSKLLKSDVSTIQLTNHSINKGSIGSVITLSDITNDSMKTMEKSLDKNNVNEVVETPRNMAMFVDDIAVVSTPLSPKSLNFKNVNIGSKPEQTLWHNSATTQEKEFMNEVFEQRLNTSANRLSSPELRRGAVQVKYCVAGSSLTKSELSKLEILCKQRGWTYVTDYRNDLTHLVFSVDEDNKCQRTLKYVRAVATGKWIVSYAWVEKCMQTKTVVKEEPFECLDMFGAPGPRRARLAKCKLFKDFTFYCMGSFSYVLPEIFKEILKESGGRVVSALQEIRCVNEKPALVLANPNPSQEDQIIDLAVNYKVVPVNYEWVINSIGSYALESIMEHLLCPPDILPPVIRKWPASLIEGLYVS